MTKAERLYYSLMTHPIYVQVANSRPGAFFDLAIKEWFGKRYLGKPSKPSKPSKPRKKEKVYFID